MKCVMNINNKTVVIIGLGYVGLPLAILASKKGYKVIGIQRNQEKVDLINKKISPFKDELVEKELAKCSVEASTDFSKISDAEIILICVPTPVYDDYKPNLTPLTSACENIAIHLQKGQTVILESTVNPGVSEDIVLPILEKGSGLKAGSDFYLAHCPERINPGDSKWNVENINRVVGSLDEEGLNKAVSFYESILTGKMKRMRSLKEAEAVKVVENSFRDINIAFVNELAMSFSHLGIDIVNVIDGAATKPFSFMAHYPGCGVGGHCIPVDPYYLIEYAKSKGFDHNFLILARRINNQMPKFTVDKVIEGLNEKKIVLNGTRVAVLGISYKPNIGDDRESPSYEIVKTLEAYGAIVATYDPYVLHKSTAKGIEDAVEGAEAVIVATAHKEFIDTSPQLFINHGVKVIVDGRNCLSKDLFVQSDIIYKGIGR